MVDWDRWPVVSERSQRSNVWRHTLHTFLIRNATSCIMDLRDSTPLGCRISRDKVVINKAVLWVAIWSTARRACGPIFCEDIVSLREPVARVKRDRSISIASTYCCQMWKPREQRSIARSLSGMSSSWRYNTIDFEISLRALNNHEPTSLREEKNVTLVTKDCTCLLQYSHTETEPSQQQVIYAPHPAAKKALKKLCRNR